MTRATYNRSNVPNALRSLLEANTEDNQTDHCKDEAHVTEPKSVLGLGTSSKLLGALVHPEIADSATELLADDKTDHDAEELEAELLRVKAEFGKEKLRNFNSEEYTAESEDDGVGDCGDPDGCVTEKRERLNEFVEAEGRRVDTLEVEVFLLESRDVVADDVAHVECLGTEEEVGDELHAVGLVELVSRL